MSAQVDRNTFIEALRQSGLLTGKQFRKVLKQLPDRARPRTIARALVQTGVITKFQAEHLLLGRAKGFFLGPYRILALLGQGGMGRVYQALHQTMNRVVALKVLAPSVLKTSRARKLFQREVQAAAQLNHPNIVTAYDAGLIEGRHYLAMEFVDGPNLEQLVRAQGPLPIGQACEIIRQAALGLQSAHEHGMVHRDIKPANLLLQRLKSATDYKVKILDFGLARLNESRAEGMGSETIMTPDNTVMGTPDFLSPEQARDLHAVDIRSDVYSLGCSFYYLLTGMVPFPGGSTLEKLVRHGKQDPTPAEDLRPGLIAPVGEILRKMMAKDRTQRFQTPDEVAEALEPYAELTTFIWQRPPTDAEMRLESSGDLPASRESEALVGTVPPQLAPTPLAGDSSEMSFVFGRVGSAWAWKLLWCGLGFLTAAALAGGAWLLFGE
ncbi:MAG: serine/threonine-protein kinase [Gemmataceae bacterium]